MKLKGYRIKDTGENIIIIPNHHGIYKIKSTGNVFESSGEIKVKNFQDLIKLNPKSRIKQIKHKETGAIISELDYLEKEKTLLQLRAYNEDDYCYSWKNLDDEFNYKKFVASYEKVYESVYEEEEVVVEEIKDVVIDTNYPFISSKFSTHGEISDVCIYNKYSAYLHFAKEKLKEIGAEEVPDMTFGKNTDGKLLWSNPSHSCIRFLKFSGKYIFNESYDIKNPKIGTFDNLVLECKKDRETIHKIINDEYLKLFGKFDESKTPVVLKAIDDIKTTLNYLRNTTATKKTGSNLNNAENLLNSVKNNLNEVFKL